MIPSCHAHYCVVNILISLTCRYNLPISLTLKKKVCSQHAHLPHRPHPTVPALLVSSGTLLIRYIHTIRFQSGSSLPSLPCPLFGYCHLSISAQHPSPSLSSFLPAVSAIVWLLWVCRLPVVRLLPPVHQHSVPITIAVIIPPSSLFLSLFSYFGSCASALITSFPSFLPTPVPIGVPLCFWSMCERPSLLYSCHSSLHSPHTSLFGYTSGTCINMHHHNYHLPFLGCALACASVSPPFLSSHLMCLLLSSLFRAPYNSPVFSLYSLSLAFTICSVYFLIPYKVKLLSHIVVAISGMFH